jgi:hypothetical protein
MSTSQASPKPAVPAIGSIMRAGLIAGLLAAAINLAVFLIGRATGVSFEYTMSGKTATIIFVQPIVSSIFFCFLGAFGLWLVSRWRNGDTAWVGLAGLLFVADTAYAFLVAADVWTAVLLTLMHVAVVGSALRLIRPSARLS